MQNWNQNGDSQPDLTSELVEFSIDGVDFAFTDTQQVSLAVAVVNGFFLKKWAKPGLFFVYFWSFQTSIITIFTTNICEKNVHPVYGAGMRTHNLWNVSLFP